ncbi:MAG: hypothetical protein KIT53_10700 [Hydrogenophaga sp.]|nr:hypothetical protein [Hydrogenophaga sp.]
MPNRNPLNRTLADGIRRMGFRKWYERELLSSHAHMALALLSAVALLASLEALGGGTPGEQFLDLAFIVVCGVITLWSLRRYIYLLMHAEEMANQANCPQCKAYGQLQLVEAQHRPQASWVPVCCKRCGFRWNLEEDSD